MAGLLYFIDREGNLAISDDRIRETIGGVSDGCQFEVANANAGPGGLSGAVVFLSFPAAPGGRPVVGYYPEKQSWHKVYGGACFVGWENNSPPEPNDLIRPNVIDGHPVKLADGKEWIIPTARVFPKGTGLPAALILGPDGELITEGLPKYAEISKSADRVWSEFERSIEGTERPDSEKLLTIQDQFSIAIEALSINYRLSKWEVSALRLITTENVVKILEALIDVPTLLEVANSQSESTKKKDHASIQGGSSSKGGKQGEAQITSRPTPMRIGSVSDRK